MSLATLTFGLVAEAEGQALGRIDGRVIDAQTDVVVAEAAVQALDARGTPLSTVVSDDRGQFSLDALPAGPYRLAVRHVAYGVSEDTLTLGQGEVLSVVYRVAATPIEVAGISVTARSTPADAAVSRGTRVDGMTAAEVDAIRPRITSMLDLLRAGNVPGFTVSEERGTMCIESNRARRSPEGTCNMVVVVVDDVIQSSPENTLALMSPEIIESWELVPALEAGTRFGNVSGHGVLEITTRGGFATPQEFVGIASIGQRWTVSMAVLAYGSSTLHEGVLRVTERSAVTNLSYFERTQTSPGLEVKLRWNSRSWGSLGATAHGSFGSSNGIYNFGEAIDLRTERDYSTVGVDLWWGAPLLRRARWNADMGIGPSFQWQSLSVTGHPDRIADPDAPQPPSVEWSDRSWFAPGAAFFTDLGYDFGLGSGAFVGFSVRLFSTSGTAKWAELDQAAILDATGRSVGVEYDSGIATALGLRTGVRWYP